MNFFWRMFWLVICVDVLLCDSHESVLNNKKYMYFEKIMLRDPCLSAIFSVTQTRGFILWARWAFISNIRCRRSCVFHMARLLYIAFCISLSIINKIPRKLTWSGRRHFQFFFNWRNAFILQLLNINNYFGHIVTI